MSNVSEWLLVGGMLYLVFQMYGLRKQVNAIGESVWQIKDKLEGEND